MHSASSSSSIKEGIRIIGIDETPFNKGDEFATLVAVVMRYGRIEDVMTIRVHVDGDDSADKIITMVRKKYSKQGKAVMIHSITTAGLNIVDIDKVSEALNCPVICITDKKVHEDMIKKIIARKFRHRLGLLKKVHKMGKYYVSFAGANEDTVRRLVASTGFEPVRVAHIIARGIVYGNE